MSTVQMIYDQAVARSNLNDAGATAVTSDFLRFFDELNRLIWALYADAAAPPEDPETERNDAFAETETVALTGSFVALTSTFILPPAFRTAGGVGLTIVSEQDLAFGRAELPPGILFRTNKVRGAGRTGDPGNGDVLTVEGTIKPATLSAMTHYIGAKTATDAATSWWPQVEAIGNDYLIDGIAAWFATRSGDRTDTELKISSDRAQASYQRVLSLLRSR